MNNILSDATDDTSFELDWTTAGKPAAIVLAAGLLAAPLVLGSTYFGIVSLLVLIFAVMTMGYNVMLGWPNLLVFCPSALAIIGGVTSALLVMESGVPFVAAMLIGGIFAGIIGVLVAYAAIIIGSAFEIVIATLAFEQIVFFLFTNWQTVGPMGISSIPSPSIGPLVLTSQIGQYLILLVILTLAVFIVAVFDHSIIGSLTIATGEDEDLLRSIGYNPSYYKIISISIGAFLLGIGGSLYAHVNGIITPDQFVIAQTILLMTIVIVGGLRTIYGPIVGAIVMISLPEITRLFGVSRARPYIVGAALIIIILFLPGGILGRFSKRHTTGGLAWRFWK